MELGYNDYEIDIIANKIAGEFEEAIKDKKFKNLETGNQVKFQSLPSEQQSKIRSQYNKSKKENSTKDTENIHSIKEKFNKDPKFKNKVIDHSVQVFSSEELKKTLSKNLKDKDIEKLSKSIESGDKKEVEKSTTSMVSTIAKRLLVLVGGLVGYSLIGDSLINSISQGIEEETGEEDLELDSNKVKENLEDHFEVSEQSKEIDKFLGDIDKDLDDVDKDIKKNLKDLGDMIGINERHKNISDKNWNDYLANFIGSLEKDISDLRDKRDRLESDRLDLLKQKQSLIDNDASSSEVEKMDKELEEHNKKVEALEEEIKREKATAKEYKEQKGRLDIMFSQSEDLDSKIKEKQDSINRMEKVIREDEDNGEDVDKDKELIEKSKKEIQSMKDEKSKLLSNTRDFASKNKDLFEQYTKDLGDDEEAELKKEFNRYKSK